MTDDFKIKYDCPICLDQILHSTIGSCTHHYCYRCIYNYCKINNLCPLCKTKIFELKLDHEFETIINGDSLNILHNDNEIIINPIDGILPGLTISNNNGPGIIITRLKPNGLFKYYNFKEKDIIIFINGLPCINHVDVVNQIMYLYVSQKPIKCILLI